MIFLCQDDVIFVGDLKSIYSQNTPSDILGTLS